MNPHQGTTQAEGGDMSWNPGSEKLDLDIFDAMTELIGQMMQRGERLAERFQVPMSCIKALRRLDPAATMKDLGQRLHCDPSFVTMIADALEQRGLARREAHIADRRIKNLVLTPHGLEVKAAIEQETLGVMPWALALDADEREQLLRLVRKMSSALAAAPGLPAAGSSLISPECAEEVSEATSVTLPVVP
jgi:MarR family transcriptional regulator, organic hydroperoxide resistance regulator